MPTYDFNIKVNIKKVIKDVIELDSDWRDIPGYPHYKINRYGQVKRIADYITDSRGFKYYRKGKILKTKTNKNGYISLTLCENGIMKGHFIHVLLVKVFIPNPNKLPVVNHIDENPSNNSLNNLEWTTYSQNAIHSINKINKSHDTERIKIIRINPYNKDITIYKGLRIAAKDNNCFHSNISKAIKTKKLYAGFYWANYYDYNLNDYFTINYNFNRNNVTKIRKILKVNVNDSEDKTIIYGLRNAKNDAKVKSLTTILNHIKSGKPLNNYIYIDCNERYS